MSRTLMAEKQTALAKTAMPLARDRWRAGCLERGTPGSEGGMEETAMRERCLRASVPTLRDASPSMADRTATAALRDAARLLGLPLVDHLIVTTDAVFSFRAADGWSD